MDHELKLHIRLRETRAKAEEHMKALVDLCNAMGNDNQRAVTAGMLDGLQGSHRTLQQCFMGNFQRLLEEYGKTAHYDARNEAAVKWARKTSTSDYMPFI